MNSFHYALSSLFGPGNNSFTFQEYGQFFQCLNAQLHNDQTVKQF